jgi:hypothetical protein
MVACIVNKLPAGRPINHSSIASRAYDFCVNPRYEDGLWGPPRQPTAPEMELPGEKFDNLPLYIADFMDEGSINSNCPCTFIACAVTPFPF